MADDNTQQRDPSSGTPGRASRDDGINEAGNKSDRRRIIITTLLAPPAVMTLNARRANAAVSSHPSMNYVAPTGKGKGGK